MLMPWLMEFCPEFFSLQKIPTISLNVSANFFCQHMTGWYPKVPASKVEALRRGAMEDLGHLNLAVETKSNDSGWKKHAQRNAWRTFRRYGIGWKVPLSVFHFTGSEGDSIYCPKRYSTILAETTSRYPFWRGSIGTRVCPTVERILGCLPTTTWRTSNLRFWIWPWYCLHIAIACARWWGQR